ncbi:MAG: hypothetical protein ACJAS1_006660 [Oleiphilaceae bacterium]|jgi:hypothetical protein
MTEDDIRKREKIALTSINSAFGTEDDEYGATMFVSHHIEEIESEYWLKHLGTPTPKPADVLNILQLKSHWDDDCVFDFTLPEDVTDYVVSVRFGENGEVEEISMES